MPPRIALHRRESLCRKLQRRNVHEQAGVDQYMRRAGKDFAPPTCRIECAVDEAIAEGGGRFCLFVTDRAEVIAGHMKALAVELALPNP
jgi:hypothetical protein